MTRDQKLVEARGMLMTLIAHQTQVVRQLTTYLETFDKTIIDEEKADTLKFVIHYMTCGNASLRLDLLAECMCKLRSLK